MDESGEERPSESLGLRELLTDATRYWERRRLVYNVTLVGVVSICVALEGRRLEEAHRSDRVGHLHQRGAGQYRLLRGLCGGCRPAAFLTALGVAEAAMVSTDNGHLFCVRDHLSGVHDVVCSGVWRLTAASTMTPNLFWIAEVPRGRLAIMARPRAGDWLVDEMAAWYAPG
jgi:hypothetical protein